MLALNSHDCKSDSCTLIETEYYMYEALRRLDGGPSSPDILSRLGLCSAHS